MGVGEWRERKKEKIGMTRSDFKNSPVPCSSTQSIPLMSFASCLVLVLYRCPGQNHLLNFDTLNLVLFW